jgi:hypothetical protein
MEVKPSHCNPGKPPRLRHKHSIRRHDSTCLFTRENLMGKTPEFIYFYRDIRVLQGQNLKLFI